MQNPFNTPFAANFGSMLARVTLGAFYTCTGYQTIMSGVTRFAQVHVNDLAKYSFVNPRAAEAYLTAMPIMQLLFGMTLAAGFFTRTSAFILAVITLPFLVATTQFNGIKGVNFDPTWICMVITIAILTNGGGTFTIPGMVGKKGGASAPKPAPMPAK